MALANILINAHVRPLADYYRNRLPLRSPAELNADLKAGLMDQIRLCAERCSVGALGAALWHEVITLCFQLMVRAHPAGAREVAEAIAVQLPALLAADLSIGDKLSVYDMLKNLFMMSAQDYAAMRPFDRLVVAPFATWIRGLDSARQRRAARPFDGTRPLRVGYLCNYAVELAPGKPAAPLFLSMILDHAEHFDHEVIVYASGEPAPGWVSPLAERGIAVRSLAFTGYAARGDVGLPASLERLRGDDLDIVLTDDNLAMPAFLYEHRVAPVQVYAPMTMTFWGLANLDYIVTGPIAAESAGAHLPHERLVEGRYCYHPRLLDRPADPEQEAALRARIPADHRIAGVFARFIKLSPDYLAALERILAANPKLSLIIAGGGDPSLILDFIARSASADRVIFFDHGVDIFTHGRVIDFFLDSFPFPSGNSTREVQYFGKPVVSLHRDEFTAYFAQSRDPELVGRTVDDYVEIAGRLVGDPGYLAARSAAAVAIGAAEVRRGGNVPLLSELLGRAAADLRAPCPTRP